MALYRSNRALGKRPVPSLISALGVTIPYEYTTEATPLAAGDIIELGPIEASVRPLDITLISDKLDTNGAPAITLTVGILNATKTDIDAAATAAWIVASNAAQTGGITRATLPAVFLAGRSDVTRVLGVKVVVAPATWAGAGKLLTANLTAGG